MKDEIFNIVTSGKNEVDGRTALETLIENLAKKINDFFLQEVRKISGRVDGTVGELVKVALPEQLNETIPATIESGKNAVVLVPENTAVVTSQNKKGALIETAATYAVAKPLLKEGIKALTPIVAKLPVLGPIIAPTLPILTPILIAVTAFKILFGGDDRKALETQMAQHRAQMQAQIAHQEAVARQRQECVEESARISRKICRGFIDLYKEKTYQLFEPMYSEIQNAIEESRSETASVMADIRLVEQSQRDLDDLTRNWIV
jgi:hypothetical protein